MSVLRLFGFGTSGWGGLLLHAMGITISVTLCALLLGTLIGIPLAAARLSHRKTLQWVAEGYAAVFRGVPELLIVYAVYFGGSGAVSGLLHLFGYKGFVSFPPFLAGVVAVGVISAAYQAEVFRGSYRAIKTGEIEAAMAIGMSRFTCFHRIVAPQIIRFSWPGFSYVFQLSVKDSSLVSITGLVEIMRATEVGSNATSRYFQFYLAGAVLYLIISWLADVAFTAAEKRSGRSFRQVLS